MDGLRFFIARNFRVSVLGALVVIIAILYFPALGANFMGDDFNWLRFLHFHFPALMEGQGWNLWLTPFMAPGKWSLFRPMLNLFFLLDYTAWELNPVGYHVTDLILHILNSFLVFLLGWQLTERRWVGVVSALLFAIMPVHVEAVSWFSARADGLSTIWYLLSVLFFVFARTRGRASFLAIALVTFGLALASKEAAMTLPAMIAAYDLLYHREEIRDVRATLRLHAPFWAMFLVYIVTRLSLYGALGSYAQSHLFQIDWLGHSETYAAALVDPFLGDVSHESWAILVSLSIAVLILYRSRREVWFGAVWLCITILPSYFNFIDTIYDRFAYLPSVGLALVFASVLTRPFAWAERWARAAGLVALCGLVIAYSLALYQRNETYARGAKISQLVPQQVRALHPTLPEDARLFFTDFPIVVVPRGVQGFGWIIDRVMQIAYNNPRLQAISIDKFPVVTDHLDRTYFFEYSRRKVTERADLIRVLEQRNYCSNLTKPTSLWDFSEDAQGWEAWNDLTDFQNRDGMLVMRATGGDPYMGGPEIDISTTAIGDIEITMRVRGSQPIMDGALYWLASGQQDFSPDLQKTFQVRADGEFHTYRVDVVQTEMLLIGDRIVRLRLDPVDAPAEIAIKAITIYAHCDTLQNQHCPCGR